MRRASVLVAAALLPVVAACGGSSASNGTSATPSRTVTVLAASSLTEPFNELSRRFHAAHPGIGVTLSYDSSTTLVQQVKAGATADVLATADETSMQEAVAAGAVDPPRVFAQNRLAILVAKGNPKGIRTLADLARPGLVVVLCAPDAPCGRFATQVLDKAGVKAQPKSLEPNVKGVVSKVTLGEADAGLVYASDVKAAGDRAEGVTIPDQQNVVARYPIATLRSARNLPAAAAFVTLVRSEQARSVLAAAGFDAAP